MDDNKLNEVKQMKKAISLLAMILLTVGMVSAYSVGNYVKKEAYVTGEYKWEDDSWVSGSWLTAVYEATMNSPTSISGYYIEDYEVLDEWKYDLKAHYGSDATSVMKNELHTWTVNPPETTPGEKHTQFNYKESNYGAYSSSNVLVRGHGQFDYESKTTAHGEAQQNVEIDIN